MSRAFTQRAGRMIAAATTGSLIIGAVVLAPVGAAVAAGPDSFVDETSGLTLGATSASGDAFSVGDTIVLTFTASNETDAVIELAEDAVVVTRVSGRIGETAGDCAPSGFGGWDEWDAGDAEIALPSSILPGETLTCTRSFVADEDDLAAGGIWAQTFSSPASGPGAPSGAFFTRLLAPNGSPNAPEVSGIPRVGETLTAAAGFFGLWNDAYEYQWLRDGAVIDGATESTYIPVSADTGATISVRVTGIAANVDGSRVVLESASTVPVGTVVLVPGTPSITGAAAVGSTLSADAGAWEPSPDAISYQWLRDGVAIEGATTAELILAAADRGARISVRVTGSLGGAESVTAESASTTAVAAGSLAVVIPTISGSVAVGSALTAKPGSWTPGTVFTYRWLRNGTTISAATSATYTPVTADAGAALSVAVTGTLPGYTSATRTSAVTAKVATAGSVTRTGTLSVGSVQTAKPGTWTTGTVFAYQWLRDGASIPGATASTYTLVAADSGKRISVAVTGTKSGYATVRKTSSASAMVTTAPVPTISGTLAVASTLTAKPGVWATGTAFTYQWLRNGAKISGATAATYKLTSSDAGRSITVTVTGAKSGYATVAKSSAASAKVATAATPKISGTVKVGATLSVVRGTWTAGTAFAYQWLRDGVKITGATKATYALTAADAGKRITVAITGRLSGFSTVTRTSASTAAVALGTLSAPTPKITGTVKVGSVLTASPGTWTSGTSLKYQWLRNGTAILGATSKSYTLRPTDAYATVTVKVTGTRTGYVAAAKSSAATAAIAGKVYANCAALNKDYPDGIRKAGVTVDRKAGVAKPLVGNPYASTSLYNLQSIARDADRDGIMCER
ncbi:hypothetical protein ACWGJP_07965 [Microbacterium sp. NPDC055903]